MSEQIATSIFDGDPLLNITEQKAYPNVKQMWWLLPISIGILIVTSFALFAVLAIIGQDWKNYELYGGPLMIVWLLLFGGYIYFRKKKFEPAYTLSFQYPPLPVLLLLLFIIPTFIISFTGIITWFHVNTWVQLAGLYQNIFPDNSIKYFILLFMFPLLEEVIYRGVILDGLLKTNKVKPAIIHAAAFVGLLSILPAIALMMFLVSLFNGWLYNKTRNLSINVFIHFLFNLFPILLPAATDPKDPGSSLEELVAEGYMPFVVISLPILGICCFLLQYYLNKKIK